MGITINYKGSLSDREKISRLISEVLDICRIMKWKYQELDDDWEEEVDAELVRTDGKLEIKGNLGLKGIGFQPHKDSEWVNLYFDKNGNICSPVIRAMQREYPPDTECENWNWVKTQFAPVKTHIAIIKLFRYIKKAYIPDLQVTDEGDYWESDNVKLLESKKNFLSNAINVLEKEFSGAEYKPDNFVSDEEYADYICKIIEDVMKGMHNEN